MTAAPKTPETVALSITGPCRCGPGFKVRDLIDPDCMWHECAADIAAARREARAAAIEEAVRELEAFGDPDYYAEAIVAIRALGEETSQA